MIISKQCGETNRHGACYVEGCECNCHDAAGSCAVSQTELTLRALRSAMNQPESRLDRAAVRQLVRAAARDCLMDF